MIPLSASERILTIGLAVLTQNRQTNEETDSSAIAMSRSACSSATKKKQNTIEHLYTWAILTSVVILIFKQLG